MSSVRMIDVRALIEWVNGMLLLLVILEEYFGDDCSGTQGQLR